MSKGRIVVDEERCKGCELCVPVCPPKVIRMADHFNSHGYRPSMLDDPLEKCTGCTLCAVICPDVVISVYRWEVPKATPARQPVATVG